MKAFLFSGSFDPITNGHMDIIERAALLCDKLVVGIITNPAKNCMFTTEEKIEMIKKVTAHIGNVEVDSFGGLLADYVRDKQFDGVVRGLRTSLDFDYEMQMANINTRLYDKFESIFLMARPQLTYVSSSNIKEIVLFKGNVEGLVPDVVLEEIKKKTQK
jgi:pantetheine-phosphate adenylyltransferase